MLLFLLLLRLTMVSSYQLSFLCVCARLWVYIIPACSSLTAGASGSVPDPLPTQGHQGPLG